VLLEKLAIELGLMPLDEFRRRTRGDADLPVVPRREDQTYRAVEEWIERTRAAGLGVPEKARAPGEPYFSLIAKVAGVDAVRLAHPAYVYRKMLEELADRVGFMDAERYAQAVGVDPRSENRIRADEARCERIRAHLHDVYIGPQGVGLPESSHRRGSPNYGAICDRAGTYFRGPNNDPAVIQLIDEAAQLVGVGTDQFRPALDVAALTFAQFTRRGVSRLQLERPDVSPKTIAIFKSALRKLQHHLRRHESDVLGTAFGSGYDETVGVIASTLKKPDTRRHWLSHMARWYGYFSTTSSNDVSLPDSFAGALLALRRRSDFSNLADALASANLKKHAQTVRNWECGKREPVQSDQTLVEAVERIYQVEPGTLTGRVRQFYRVSVADLRIDVWPSCIDTPRLRRLAKPLLPDNFAFLSVDEREAIGLSIRAEAETQIPFRQKCRTAERWRLREIPAQLQEEWDALVDYKTSDFPRFDRASSWRPGSVDRFWSVLHEVFSALALDRQEGGLGVSPEDMTLALCGMPSVVRWFAQWKLSKSPEGYDTGARTWLGLFGHLSAPVTKNMRGDETGAKGYLRYVPELASRVRQIPGVITASDIARLQTSDGWNATLTEANAFAWKTFASHRSKLRLSRDPFAPILPILDSDRPMDVFVDILKEAYDDLPDPRRTTELKRALAVRRFVTALTAFRTALCRRNLEELTGSGNQQGEIKRIDGRWPIEIKAQNFKNGDKRFFNESRSTGRAASSYMFEFEEQDFNILNEYADKSRPALLDHAGKTSAPTFLVTRKGRPVSGDQITNELHDLTWKHAVYHEVSGKGIKGVEAFGTHAIRDITVTHILKTTGDIRLAAYAIQDTERTVLEYYARFLTQDKTKLVSKFLRADLPAGNWGS
jgi:hypothetical protein